MTARSWRQLSGRSSDQFLVGTPGTLKSAKPANRDLRCLWRVPFCRVTGFGPPNRVAVSAPCRLEVGAGIALSRVIARLALPRPNRVGDDAKWAQHRSKLTLAQLVRRAIALRLAEFRPP